MGRLGVARYTTRTLHGSAMLGPSQPKHTSTVYGDDENWNKDRLAWAQRLLLYLAHGAQQVPLADVPVGSHGLPRTRTRSLRSARLSEVQISGEGEGRSCGCKWRVRVRVGRVPAAAHIGNELDSDPGKRLRAALGRAEQARSDRRACDTGGSS